MENIGCIESMSDAVEDAGVSVMMLVLVGLRCFRTTLETLKIVPPYTEKGPAVCAALSFSIKQTSSLLYCTKYILSW